MITKLELDLEGNDVNDFSPLSKFIQFHNLESIKLTIKKKANLVFLNDLNNLTKLADFALDYETCHLENKFIYVKEDATNIWECAKCQDLCLKCQGYKGSECTTCYRSQIKLKDGVCYFDFLPVIEN